MQIWACFYVMVNHNPSVIALWYLLSLSSCELFLYKPQQQILVILWCSRIPLQFNFHNVTFLFTKYILKHGCSSDYIRFAIAVFFPAVTIFSSCQAIFQPKASVIQGPLGIEPIGPRHNPSMTYVLNLSNLTSYYIKSKQGLTLQIYPNLPFFDCVFITGPQVEMCLTGS